MGKEVAAQSYSREERQRYREKVQQNLDVFERMLNERAFDEEVPLTGLEIELNLIDDGQQPAFVNDEVLEAIADPEYQTELAQFNIELNVAPRPLPGDSALRLEESLRESLNRAESKAEEAGARIIAIGILPTIRPEHFQGEWISDNNRYTALNDSIFVARGEDIVLDIEGPTGERLHTFADSIAPESACTSVQLHLQVGPTQFADHWNAAQIISAPQLALAANSPFFFGRRLHAETRVALFAQATDTRPIELKNQGVRPRVFFGERWITSIFDLFEENVRYFPALLAEATEEDPVAVLDAGGTPSSASSTCTTAPSTGGTARSTIPARGTRTSASKTVSCPPARRSSTPWPTPPSTTAACARWPTRTGPSGPGCPSRPRRPTSRRRPATASTPGSTGPASASSAPTSSCCATCCRWPDAAWRTGAWPRESSPATCRSSRDAAPRASTAPCGRASAYGDSRRPGWTGLPPWPR